MAQNKNKQEILDLIITKSGLEDYLDYGEYWDYDDDWGRCDYCGSWHCFSCGDYEYLYTGFTGAMIDMNSIYSKEILRQKRIDYILGNGEEPNQNLSQTLGDFWNIKK